MSKDLNYYMSLNYPIECYGGEHEIGDAFLAIYTDFDIKASCEDPEEAKAIAKEYLKEHIAKALESGEELPKPGEGVRFKEHRRALAAYRAKDYETAKAIWEVEAKFKNDQAMTNLGLLYLKGEGVEKDFSKAKEWFEKASLYDNPSANYNLAQMYQGAIGVAEDVEKAIEYFRRAVAYNHQLASFRLGLLLLKDRTNIEYVKEGFESMLRAAKSGHAMAKIQMGGVDRVINSNATENAVFRNKSVDAQLEVVKDAIERYIRPILVKDGGDILLIDYKIDPNIEIRLAYQGSCAGCSLAATSTYDLILNTLMQVIDEKIEVYVI
jgi:Fe-S cluster biogenesis protein NfuA